MTPNYVNYVFPLEMVLENKLQKVKASIAVELFPPNPNVHTYFKGHLPGLGQVLWGTLRVDGLVSFQTEEPWQFFNLSQLDTGLRQMLKVAYFASWQLMGAKAKFTAEPVEGLKEWDEDEDYPLGPIENDDD